MPFFKKNVDLNFVISKEHWLEWLMFGMQIQLKEYKAENDRLLEELDMNKTKYFDLKRQEQMRNMNETENLSHQQTQGPHSLPNRKLGGGFNATTHWWIVLDIKNTFTILPLKPQNESRSEVIPFSLLMGKDSKGVCALKSMKMPQIKMWMIMSICCQPWNFQACMGCYHMLYVRSKDEWNKDK